MARTVKTRTYTETGVSNDLASRFNESGSDSSQVHIAAGSHPEFERPTPLETLGRVGADIYHKGASFMGGLHKLFTGK